jgi:hypothetical protein
MSDIPTKTYPPSFLHALIADHEAERAGATPEASSAIPKPPKPPFCLCVVKQRLRRERFHKAIDRLCYALEMLKDDAVSLPELRDRVVEWFDAMADMETQFSMGGRDE